MLYTKNYLCVPLQRYHQLSYQDVSEKNYGLMKLDKI